MRLLLLVHSLRRGGAERVLLEVALGLLAKGHRVEVVSWLDLDEYGDQRYRSIQRHYLVPKNDYRWPLGIPRAAAALRQVAANFRPDAIEVHTPTIAWVAAWGGLGVAAIHVLHGYGGITRAGKVKDWLVRLGDRIARRRLRSQFIVVTPPMIDIAAGYYSMSRSGFSYVPNGIECSDKQVQFKAPTQGNPIILMVGTLSASKGQSWGVKALSAVIEQIPNVRLHIVGEGDSRRALEDLIGDLGLADRVQLLGRQERVLELMAQSHVLWHLSDSEGLPMVLLEAMSVGLPVVGFNVRGVRDLVVDGGTGYLVPYGDTRLVAERTIHLLTETSTYGRFAETAQKLVAQYFSIKRMIDGHERVLAEALERCKQG